MQNTIKSIVVLILVFIIGIFYLSLNKSSNYDTEYLVGNKIKDIKLESFENKKFVTINELKTNKFTLINFWASWCAPCRAEHSFLMKLSKERDLKILGVNFKDKKKSALEFLNELGNPYDYLASDRFGKQSVSFGIYGIPETILTDNNLIILKKFIGPLTDKDFNDIKQIINSL